MNRFLRGREKEDLAVRYLTSKGYTILYRNFRTKFGEIDIVAEDGDCLVFVEVRSKSTEEFGTPEESINRIKIERIRRTAQYYLLNCEVHYVDVRFDVVSISGDKLEHIQNAFWVEF